MKFSTCWSLIFLFHCMSLQATWPHRNKGHQMFFFLHHLNSFTPLPFTQPHFLIFTFSFSFSETLCVTVPPPAPPHLYCHLTRYLLILFISSRSILITLLSIIYLFLKIQKSEVFLPELWDLCLIWFWLADFCFYSLLLQYLIIFR